MKLSCHDTTLGIFAWVAIFEKKWSICGGQRAGEFPRHCSLKEDTWGKRLKLKLVGIGMAGICKPFNEYGNHRQRFLCDSLPLKKVVWYSNYGTRSLTIAATFPGIGETLCWISRGTPEFFESTSCLWPASCLCRFITYRRGGLQCFEWVTVLTKNPSLTQGSSWPSTILDQRHPAAIHPSTMLTCFFWTSNKNQHVY